MSSSFQWNRNKIQWVFFVWTHTIGFVKPDQKKKSNKNQGTKQSNSHIGKNKYNESCNKDIRNPFIFGPDSYPYVVYKNVGDGNYWMVSIRHLLPTPKIGYFLKTS